VEQQHELVERLESVELQANALGREIGHQYEPRGNADPKLDGRQPAEAMARVLSPFLESRLLTLLKVG
jgi:hypothetical protein